MQTIMISKERLDEINSYFWEETNEDWTQEWRDNLTDEEADLMDEMDDKFAIGMYRIAERIIELDEKRRDGAITG